MRFPSLPPGADDSVRLAYAGFALSMVTMQLARAGGNITAEGWAMMLRPIAEMYGQGDSPAAAWIRDGIKAADAPLGTG